MKKMTKRLQKKLDLLGLGKVNAKTIIIFRFVSSIILFLILLLVSRVGYVLAPIITIIYYFLVEYLFIDLGIYYRGLKLEEDALEFFNVFSLSLKGGRNVKKAIAITTDIVDNELSIEFKKVLNDLKVGKSLEEALMLLESRIPSESINNILINIREANRFGNDISSSIDKQLSLINAKQEKKLIKKYKVVPLYLTIVSISFTFIMLSVLIVLAMFL